MQPWTIKHLLKNITDLDGVKLTADTGRASGVFYMATRAAGVAFSSVRTASETATGAACIIDDVDSDRVYFHQNEETGFTSFSSNGTLTSGSISEQFDSVDYSLDVDRYSGELFYIENREKFVRSAGQSEDIKVIITL